MPKKQETRVPFLGGEDPLEEGVATHISILARIIPRTEEPGELCPMPQESNTAEETEHARMYQYIVLCFLNKSYPKYSIS